MKRAKLTLIPKARPLDLERTRAPCPSPVFVDDGWPPAVCSKQAGHAGDCAVWWE